MAILNRNVPQGFTEFQAPWHTKASQFISNPFQLTGYDLFIKREAQSFLEILSPYQQYAIS